MFALILGYALLYPAYGTYTYVVNDPVSRTDLLGLAPPSAIPPGVDISQNVSQAGNMSTWDFYRSVRSSGQWDYKTLGRQYEDFGNYHFGVVGRANGWSENTLVRGAGAYQKWSGTSKPQWGWPWGSSPYGDDPNDQRWIREGVHDYEEGRYTPNICPR